MFCFFFKQADGFRYFALLVGSGICIRDCFYPVEYQYICKSGECTAPLIKNKSEVTQKEKKMLANEILESLPDGVLSLINT